MFGPAEVQRHAHHPAQVMVRHLSTAQPDACVLEEPDPQRFLELSRTKDGAYVAINSNSKIDSEVRPLKARSHESSGC